MEKSSFFFVLTIIISTFIFSFTCCSEKKSAQTTDSLYNDSIAADTLSTDTLETIIAETPMPRAADELFDDFFFNFAASRKLQLNRIKFPLLITHEDSATQHLSQKQWVTEHFFMDQDFYTLIFNNRKQMNIVKDTTVKKVSVEKIFLNKHKVKKYNFDRIDGKWLMTSIGFEGFTKNNNASFLNFYSRFANDTTFQVQSINDPLAFTGPSPVDEFENMEGFITAEQWLSFAPELPQGMIYNIQYDEPKHKNSHQKIFVIRGISNGQEAELTFQIKDGSWKLVKLNM